jgi:hypothetical protein
MMSSQSDGDTVVLSPGEVPLVMPRGYAWIPTRVNV